jgi:ketosteroid isomerase-like protein
MALTLILHTQAWAQEVDEADLEQVAGKVYASFFEAMTNVEMDKVVGLFTEDALFWGTNTRELATDTAGVNAYFSVLRGNAPGQNVFRPVDYEVVVLDANTLLLSGRWEAGAATAATFNRMRISMVLVKRGEAWKIAQFHNSLLPQ